MSLPIEPQKLAFCDVMSFMAIICTVNVTSQIFQRVLAYFRLNLRRIDALHSKTIFTFLLSIDTWLATRDFDTAHYYIDTTFCRFLD